MVLKMQLMLLLTLLTLVNSIDLPSLEGDENIRRDYVCPGCVFDLKTNAQGINELVEGALQHIESERSEKHALVNILSIQSQVVSGVLYILTIEVAPTVCSKESEGSCSIRTDRGTLTCKVVFLNQPWEGRIKEIINNNCTVSQNFIPKVTVPAASSPVIQTTQRNEDFLSEIESQIIPLTPETERLAKDNSPILKSDYKLPQRIYSMYAPSYNYHISPQSDNIWQRFIPLEDNLVQKEDQGADLNTYDESVQEVEPLYRSKRSLMDSNKGVYEEKYQFVEDELKAESQYEEEQELFNYFMKKYKKFYGSEYEQNRRLQIFRNNLKTIRLLNKFDQGTATYGLTKFADLTRDEFSRRHGLRTDLRTENEIPFAQASIPNIDLPTEFDWRSKNAVTKVKDQGNCGSCWAFSTTGNVEGQYAIKYGNLLEFSEQELVDCDKVDEGCNGGLMDNAYRVIENLGGLETEKDYPYEAENEKCAFVKSKSRVQLSGALNISHDETDMAKWLVANGPISIAINANGMQFYMGGISHPWKFLCSSTSLDHGVLIVGYGVHQYKLFNKTLPYWIVKNSWGTSWGEQGYYRVYRGDGTCGLNQTPSSAIVA